MESLEDRWALSNTGIVDPETLLVAPSLVGQPDAPLESEQIAIFENVDFAELGDESVSEDVTSSFASEGQGNLETSEDQGVNAGEWENSDPSLPLEFSTQDISAIDAAMPPNSLVVTLDGSPSVETFSPFDSRDLQDSGPSLRSGDPVTQTDAAPPPSESTLTETPATGPATRLSVSVAQSPTCANPACHGVSATAETFRIARSASGGAVEVRFSLGVHGSQGSTFRESTITIASGATHADIPATWVQTARSQGQEIATLTIHPLANQHVVKPVATLFFGGNERNCSEASLLEAYRQGRSPDAFNVLYELHRGTVLKTCYGILGSLPDAEDVSQVVFMMLAQGQVQLHRTLSGWLRTVARNAAIGFLRSRNRRTRHELEAAKPDAVGADETSNGVREEIDAAMTRLPEHLREAVSLRYLDGWSQKEAADLVGCPRGTLSQRAARGIQHLRVILADEKNLAG